MEGTSSDNAAGGAGNAGVGFTDIHVRTPDDTILLCRKRSNASGASRDTAVLVVPPLQATLAHGTYDRLCAVLPGTVYLLELRGHGLSEGKWSLQEHEKDIEFLVGELRRHFSAVMLVSFGGSASILLDMENRQRLHADAMVLVTPDILPCPVRVQTPTTVFAPDAILHRIFGNVHLHHAPWAQKLLPVEQARQAQLIRDALHELSGHERPIRFKGSTKHKLRVRTRA